MKVSGDASPVIGAVHPLPIVRDKLAGDDSGCAGLAQSLQLCSGESAALDQMAIVLDATR